MSSLICLENVGVSYGGRRVIDGVSLTLSEGEIVMIVGPNGAGKSTLLRSLVAHTGKISGRIEKAEGLRIGYMPQNVTLNRLIPIRVEQLLNLPAPQPPHEIKAVLEDVGFADGLKQNIHTLSGGQLQRVLLARALLNKPHLILLDEPTSGLDPNGVMRFYGLLKRLRTNRQFAVVMVSHELHIVMEGADRVICFNGHICCQGSPEKVSEMPEYHALFGGAFEKPSLAFYRHKHDHEHI